MKKESEIQPSLSKVNFYTEYLQKHERFLESIASWIPGRDRPEKWIGRALDARDDVSHRVGGARKQVRSNSETNRRVIQNLLNAWTAELSLNDPPSAGGTDRMVDRMRMPQWKIVQFYYSTLFAAGTFARLSQNTERPTHVDTLNVLTSSYLSSPSFETFFFEPWRTKLKAGALTPDGREYEWEYGRKHHLPVIRKALEWTKSQFLSESRKLEAYSLFHYFLKLREAANYRDGHVFMDFYGEGPKGRFDWAMRLIAARCVSFAEIYCILVFGHRPMFKLADMFVSQVRRNIGDEPRHFMERFLRYRAVLGE